MSAISVILMTAALGLALFAWRVLEASPQLEITDRGILDRRLALGWLDWEAIEGAYRPRRPDGERVLLRVRVDSRLGRRLRRRSADERQPIPEQVELSLDLAGTRYTEVEVLHQIMAHSRAKTVGAGARLSDDENGVPCR